MKRAHSLRVEKSARESFVSVFAALHASAKTMRFLSLCAILKAENLPRGIELDQWAALLRKPRVYP